MCFDAQPATHNAFYRAVATQSDPCTLSGVDRGSYFKANSGLEEDDFQTFLEIYFMIGGLKYIKCICKMQLCE